MTLRPVVLRGESLRGEPLRAAAIALVAALAVVALAPPGGDSAAHLYRTMLVRDGVAVWDNLWFGGQYPLASYSPLYYLPAALVGNVPLVVAAVVASAALFASVATHEWGADARWPARAFGLLAAGPLFTGTYSYAAGLAAALACLRLLQLRRPWLAVVAAGLALGFSPLAFAFLCVVLGAVAAGTRPTPRRTAVVAGGLLVVVLVQAVVLWLFPSEGRYPFSPLSLTAALVVSALGAALARRTERGRLIAPFFVLWALVCLGAFLVPSPFGDNLTRLRGLVFPLVLLAAVLARFRPRWLAAGAVAFALAYNLGPDVSALPKRADDRPTATESYWRPALDFIAARHDPDHRVEVVPTFGHWEAWWVPREGFALARGWYRQIDLAENPELYENPLEPAAYRRWLDRMAVRWVLLPDARLGPMGADREAALLRSGRAGLRPAFRSAHWVVYEVPRARPILEGGSLTALAHERIEGVAGTGRHRLRVRWNRYWEVEAGAVCVEPRADGQTTLVARGPGRFALVVGRGGGRCNRADD
ncbi:MAG TPA: hypothetical protein VK874_02260 [Gaiellaceae bacterium]|nr:hypothetical protein [Gaiellaceae bacterium]